MSSYRKYFIEAHGLFPHPCYFCGKPVASPGGVRHSWSTVIHHIDLDSYNHDPQNLAAAHQGCHTRYHSALREPVVQVGPSYRSIFIGAHGPWPHQCYFCDEVVDGHTSPFDSTAAVVHHINGDETDHDLSNLAGAHHGCHVSYHARHRTPETREKIGQGRRGKKASPELRERLRTAHLGVPLSPQHAANIAAALRTPAARAKNSAAHRGVKLSPEHRERLRTANLGRKPSPETIEKIRAANTGKTHTPETRAKLSAMRIGRVVTPETRAKIGAAHKGRILSPETRALLSAALTGKPHPKVSCLRCRRTIGVRALKVHLRSCGEHP
jgi:hypothetical protein